MYFPSIETLVATTAPQVAAFTSALWSPVFWLVGIAVAGIMAAAIIEYVPDILSWAFPSRGNKFNKDTKFD